MRGSPSKFAYEGGSRRKCRGRPGEGREGGREEAEGGRERGRRRRRMGMPPRRLRRREPPFRQPPAPQSAPAPAAVLPGGAAAERRAQVRSRRAQVRSRTPRPAAPAPPPLASRRVGRGGGRDTAATKSGREGGRAAGEGREPGMSNLYLPAAGAGRGERQRNQRPPRGCRTLLRLPPSRSDPSSSQLFWRHKKFPRLEAQ